MVRKQVCLGDPKQMLEESRHANSYCFPSDQSHLAADHVALQQVLPGKLLGLWEVIHTLPGQQITQGGTHL